jgi:hypothetical protein
MRVLVNELYHGRVLRGFLELTGCACVRSRAPGLDHGDVAANPRGAPHGTYALGGCARARGHVSNSETRRGYMCTGSYIFTKSQYFTSTAIPDSSTIYAATRRASVLGFFDIRFRVVRRDVRRTVRRAHQHHLTKVLRFKRRDGRKGPVVLLLAHRMDHAVVARPRSLSPALHRTNLKPYVHGARPHGTDGKPRPGRARGLLTRTVALVGIHPLDPRSDPSYAAYSPARARLNRRCAGRATRW